MLSHFISLFIIFMAAKSIFQTGPDEESHIRVGKLNMVDLAGSERQAKTGAKVSLRLLIDKC